MIAWLSGPFVNWPLGGPDHAACSGARVSRRQGGVGAQERGARLEHRLEGWQAVLLARGVGAKIRRVQHLLPRRGAGHVQAAGPARQALALGSE